MNNRLFVRLGISTIAAVYFLILVGGIVRASGSGMGCPDWPKCFGTWIPPTSVNQLPGNYQEVFGEKLKGEVVFNVYKTWTEYLNRLLGVLIGFLIFLTFVSSIFSFWSKDKKVVFLSLIAFVLVGFQGWLGSKVVSTELLPWMVTTHLLVAVLIVFVLIWAIVLAYKKNIIRVETNSSLNFALPLLFVLSFGQFILGTRVRESVDHMNLNGLERANWIDGLGGSFYIHIFLAIIVLVLHWYIFLKEKPHLDKTLRLYFVYLIAIVCMSFLTGSVLGLFKMTAYAQPLHLTFATLILGCQFSIFLINNRGRFRF